MICCSPYSYLLLSSLIERFFFCFKGTICMRCIQNLLDVLNLEIYEQFYSHIRTILVNSSCNFLCANLFPCSSWRLIYLCVFMYRPVWVANWIYELHEGETKLVDVTCNIKSFIHLLLDLSLRIEKFLT